MVDAGIIRRRRTYYPKGKGAVLVGTNTPTTPVVGDFYASMIFSVNLQTFNKINMSDTQGDSFFMQRNSSNRQISYDRPMGSTPAIYGISIDGLSPGLMNAIYFRLESVNAMRVDFNFMPNLKTLILSGNTSGPINPNQNGWMDTLELDPLRIVERVEFTNMKGLETINRASNVLPLVSQISLKGGKDKVTVRLAELASNNIIYGGTFASPDVIDTTYRSQYLHFTNLLRARNWTITIL